MICSFDCNVHLRFAHLKLEKMKKKSKKNRSKIPLPKAVEREVK